VEQRGAHLVRVASGTSQPIVDPSSAAAAEFLPLSRPDVGIAEVAELLDAVRSGWVTTGPKVEVFEQRLAAYVGVEHIRCLSSCTAGLLLALKVSGIGPDDEVLIPTLTFVSCANVVEQLGARPVFVDCEPDSGLIDLDAAERLVGPATRAMVAVHLAGRPLNMDRLNALRDRYGLVVVEDAAHAIGAEWDGRRVGAHGNLTSFSFHATKNMTTFEGGALVVPDEATSSRVRQLSLHGLSRSSWSRHGRADAYDVLEPGYKLGMHDVAAAVGIHQLSRLDGWIKRRAELAHRYDEQLEGLPLDRAPQVVPRARHAHHLYPVRLTEAAPLPRDDVAEGLRAAGIGSSVHFRPIHTLTYYAERYGLAPDELPAALGLATRLLSLPLFPQMSEDDVDRVSTTLASLLS
jgi:dTDP-4-amino-4,6-dideoxygalactose transaminase